MTNPFLIRLILPAFFCLSGLASMAQPSTLTDIPNPKTINNTYVSDPDGILKAEEVATLNDICREVADSTTAQIAVVILQSIGDEDPKDFATSLFNHWGIGQAENDNGLLVLTVMDQRRTEFETGYGMEGILPDAICYRISMQELVPYFRNGQYGQGLEAALRRVRNILLDPEARAELQEELKAYGPIPWWRKIPVPLFIYGLVMILWALAVELWTLAQLVSKQELYDKYMNIRKLHWAGWAFLFPPVFILIYFLNRRLLKRLRNKTRYSPLNGKKMVKLSEGEDDALLEQGQIIEEQLGAIDYDVWITEDRDDVLIQAYKKRWTKYKACPECRYKTYYKARTETLKKATSSQSGKGVHIYECKNCHYRKKEEFTIARKSSGGGVGGFSGGSSFGGGGSSFGGGSSGGGGAGVSW